MFNRSRTGGGITLLIALVLAGFSLFRYLGTSQVNPTTGEKQHISLTSQQEVALGLQAAPQMAQQYGGLSQNARAIALVERVGKQIAAHSDATKSPYTYDFHLLADPKTVNAFALPGGQVFLTEGLMRRLRTEGELAGVLGHEIGHVIGRHSAEQLSQQQLTQGLATAAGVASSNSDDPYRGQKSAALAAALGQLMNLKYSRSDELEADDFGLKLMAQAGYDPRAMLGVMEVLQKASQGGAPVEFFSTHPNPENRSAKIKDAIHKDFPSGVPGNLKP